jgi:hypothetical protein
MEGGGVGTTNGAEGRVALYGSETAEYEAFAAGERPGSGGEVVEVTYAMRSRR